MRSVDLRVRWLTCAAALLLAALPASCGGGGGAGVSKGGLVLLSFVQGGQDNVPLNRVFQFDFSEDIDPNSIFVIDPSGRQRSTGAIQMREGSAFGVTVVGDFEVLGSRVLFKPRLPGLCDFSDAGLRPDTQYRVTIVGYPESFAVKGTRGQYLDATSTAEFHTRGEDDPLLLEDQIPSKQPTVLFTAPEAGTAAVDITPDDTTTPAVYEGNEFRIRMSENLNPCTVNEETVLIHEYARGNPGTFIPAPNGNVTGFNPATDQAPSDPYSWGSGTLLDPPIAVRASVRLFQDFDLTEIVIRPEFTEWPDNALIVVELTFEMRDFGGLSIAPVSFAFTTENRPLQNTCRVIEFAGETPFDSGLSTADVNTTRAPGLAQGFLLFSGDGDNGTNLLTPTLPETPASTCLLPRQGNDGVKDDFDPAMDVLLDTGATANTCPNTTDGSNAVVWEFRTFRIRPSITVRVVGVNPAIILVQGDVLIENGGRILARGDNIGGAPQSRGASGASTTTVDAPGGKGVAGGGNGGTSLGDNGAGTPRYGGHGVQGYYHGAGGALGSDIGVAPGTGGGHGNSSVLWNRQINPNNMNSPSGGGGGHATDGVPGVALGTGSYPTSMDLTPDGAAGKTYGASNGSLPYPEAGSGGGAGGEIRPFTGNTGRGTGGAGGAGGGFLDLTAGGDIVAMGIIDAAGGAGGNGATQPFNPNYTFQPGTGGGGGGSGGGIRLITPNDIIMSSSTVVTAAGGAGGAGGDSQSAQPPKNPGGAGAPGRVVLEDGDSMIVGLPAANVVPGEGTPGFYRATFDATRFLGGGLEPEAVSQLFFVGPTAPAYSTPGASNFLAGIPPAGSRGLNSTGILLEARGYAALPDGGVDTSSSTGWFTVGYFTDSGDETQPNWFPSANPPDVTLPPDNVGAGIVALTGRPWIQVRITFFLPLTMQPLDPGPYVDRWDLCFTYDQ